MDYKKMTDGELANIMINQINRVSHLQHMISTYLDKPLDCKISSEKIKTEYKTLKNEIKLDASYLDLVKNQKGSNLYMNVFSPSIREAYAEGFDVPVNSKIDFKMFSAVATAHYKLTKYYSLEDWGKVK